MADLRRYLTDPTLIAEGFFRQISSYSVFKNKSEFRVRVLTPPTLYSGTDKVWFKGRILDKNMPHEKFLPDPCDNSIAANKGLTRDLVAMHSTVLAEGIEGSECAVGDTILAFIDPGDNNNLYDLQNLKFIKIDTKNEAPLKVDNECFTLSQIDFGGSISMGAILGNPNVPYEDISKNQKSYYHGRLVLNGRLEEGYVAIDSDGEVIVDSNGDATFVDMSNEEPIVVSPWTEENDYYVPKVHNRNKKPTRFIKELIEPFQKLCKDYYDNTGKKIVINDSYRSFERQIQMKAKYGGRAATPGTSDHGWGVAFDVDGTNEADWGTKDLRRYESKVYKALTALSNTSGFFNPTWAQPGGSNMESWHWENITVRNQVYDQTLPDYAIGSAGEPIDGKTEPIK